MSLISLVLSYPLPSEQMSIFMLALGFPTTVLSLVLVLWLSFRTSVERLSFRTLFYICTQKKNIFLKRRNPR